VCVCVCLCVRARAFFKTKNEKAAVIYLSIQCNYVYKDKFGTEIIIT